MIYTCEKCGVKFSRKSCYTQHMNRKTSCVESEKLKQDICNKTCMYCKRVFSRPIKMKEHLSRCKSKPTKTEELTELMLKLTEKIDDQNKKIDNLQNKQNITNNTVNIQQNIIVTPYGKEDVSHVTFEDYAHIFTKGCYAIPEFVKYIHCNDKKPENRNIYIKNYKDEYILTFDGIDWNIERKDDVFGNLIENKKNFLESKYDVYCDDLPKPAKILFKKFLDRSDNNEVINNIKDELRNEFYKNRHYIKKQSNIIKKKEKKLTKKNKTV